MPSIHFTSPYGHVKPPLLHALSLKRKKSHVAAAAAAAVFKAFTNPRGKNVLLRQGVKYRNMFHSGGGLVRERQPGEEVTPERGWVTDEESEQSEAEEVIPVNVEMESVVEMSEPEEETAEEPEVLVMAVEDSAIDVIQEQEEVAKTDLLKLELSLAEKEIPQVTVPEKAVIEVNVEVVEAPVVPVQNQEPTSDSSISEVVEQEAPVEMPLDEVEEQIPEQLMVEVLEPVEEQESVTELGTRLEEEAADIVLPPSELKPELILEPSHREPLSLTSVMNILEPSERGPLSLTAMMNILEPSKPVPVPLTVAMEIVEAPRPEPLAPMVVIEVPEVPDIPELHSVQQIESIAEVKDTEVMEPEEMSKEVVEGQQEMKVELEQLEEATICEAIVDVEEAKMPSSEESNVEDEAVTISLKPDQISEKESEVEEMAPEPQLILSPSIAVPTLEVQSEELKEKIVEEVLPIRVQVISPQPPQETPVLAISEKHSEHLFDDEVCEYDETELNEDEEPEVEVELENQELEGLLEFTPSHMFKLTLPLPSSTNNPASSTVALCVKPEQTLLDLQKLIQLELPHALTGPQQISFTTLGIEPPDRTTDIAPRPDSTGFAIKDGEHTILRKSSYSDPSKYNGKPTCTPTRWSLSTEIGAFIGDAAKSQCFTIGISIAPGKPPSINIRISLPSFSDRTLQLRSQLRILAPNLSTISALKSECDAAAQRTAQRRSILTLAVSGFACLLLPILLITFAYLSQPGLLPSFRNTPPSGLKVTHPVTTYIAAGLADILLLAGFAYVWSAYRMTGRHNVPDIATVKKVYSERGLDVAKWEELQTESARLRSEIRRAAAEYGVSWDDDEVEETKETGTAATAA